MKQALETDSTNSEFYDISGQIDLVAARWKMLQHENPDPEIKSALLWLNRALEVASISNFDALCSKAKVYQWWAEWKLETKRSADKESQLGLDVVSRALEIRPRSSEMIGMRGVFWLFQARSISNIAQRRELAEKARAGLEEALRINRNLSHTYAPFLKEAETLRN